MPKQEPVKIHRHLPPAARIHLPFLIGEEVPGETGASGTRRGHTQLTQPAPSPPAPSKACWLLQTTGCPASSPSTWWQSLHHIACSGRPHVAPVGVHSVAHSREETARKTKRHQRPPFPPHQRLLQCESGGRQKEGLPKGSTIPHPAAAGWRLWQGLWPGRAAPHSLSGSPKGWGCAGSSWGGRRGCRVDGKTCGCHCEWAKCPRSRHTGCWSRESQGVGPGWSWWLGWKNKRNRYEAFIDLILIFCAMSQHFQHTSMGVVSLKY